MQPAIGGIQKLLRKKLNIDSDVLTPQTELKRDLNLADWELLYLLNAIEQAWQVSLSPKDTENIVCVQHLLEAVRNQQKTRRAA